MSENYVGYFRGRKTIQRSATIGGARSVFVKLQGNKNELVYPTFGGQIKNPFKGAAKMFAGDLMEYRTDENGLNPEIYILKTYKFIRANQDAFIEIERTPYSHIPFVGDKIGKVSTAGGVATSSSTITKVYAMTNAEGMPIWKCEVAEMNSTEYTTDDVLVEVGEDGKMLVKNINAVAPTDMDMLDAPATGDEDFDGARYFYTPALGGIMYTNKMSPLPECVKALNQSKVNGWFQIQSV